jgi:phage major head subunit gpT-like protein
MKINNTALKTLGVGFKASFQQGIPMAGDMSDLIATTVPSTTGKEEYGWLGKFPKMREWIGDRVINNLEKSDYAIKNKDYENTIGVDRNDIEDDNLGIYGPMFQEMGRATEAFKSELCFPLLKAGFATKCYDGQFFFDTDHPVLDGNGVVQSVANTDGGAGPAWFLADLSRPLKPIIFQSRKAFDFVAMDNPDDANVFHKKQFVYGVDGRCNVGYGFWQFAWGSKQALDTAHYAAAFAGLEGMLGDFGRPLGIKPTHLIVPPALREAGQRLIKNENDAAGASNPWKDTATLVVVPWLA